MKELYEVKQQILQEYWHLIPMVHKHDKKWRNDKKNVCLQRLSGTTQREELFENKYLKRWWKEVWTKTITQTQKLSTISTSKYVSNKDNINDTNFYWIKLWYEYET